MEKLQEIDRKVDDAQPELQGMFREAFAKTQHLEAERDAKMKTLDQRITKLVLLPLIDELCQKYCDHERTVDYILSVKDDILRNLKDFLPTKSEGDEEEGVPQQAVMEGFGFPAELAASFRHDDVSLSATCTMTFSFLISP